MSCIYHFCFCQELRPSFLEEDIGRGSKSELDALSQQYIQEKGFTDFKIWKRQFWRLYKTTSNVEQLFRQHFFYRHSLSVDQTSEEIKKGELFCYFQCDNEIPEHLRTSSCHFPPTLKNTSHFSYQEYYPRPNAKLCRRRNTVVSTWTMVDFELQIQNVTLIIPLLFFIWIGFCLRKKKPFWWIHLKICLNGFVQPAVD